MESRALPPHSALEGRVVREMYSYRQAGKAEDRSRGLQATMRGKVHCAARCAVAALRRQY